MIRHEIASEFTPSWPRGSCRSLRDHQAQHKQTLTDPFSSFFHLSSPQHLRRFQRPTGKSTATARAKHMTIVLPATTSVDNQQTAAYHTPTAPQKKTFGTVFRFRSPSRHSEDDSGAQQQQQLPRESSTLGRNTFFTRNSVDTPPSYTTRSPKRRPHTAGRFGVTNVSFFERASPSAAAAQTTPINNNNNTNAPTPTPQPTIIDLTLDNMKALDTNIPPSSRRGPVRMDTQDGPWSVSVAETPYDARSYSLYIKSESVFRLSVFRFFLRRCLSTPWADLRVFRYDIAYHVSIPCLTWCVIILRVSCHKHKQHEWKTFKRLSSCQTDVLPPPSFLPTTK